MVVKGNGGKNSFELQVALKILGCVKLVDGNVGRTKVAGILTGCVQHYVFKYKYNETEYFGALARFTKHEVLQMIDQLIETGYIEQQFIAEKPYLGLKLTRKGEAIVEMDGEGQQEAVVAELLEEFKLPWSLESKPVSAPRNREIYDALREMRKVQAAIERVQEYKVITNRTILELAEKQPQSYDELYQIHGLGDAKITKYGALILQVLTTMLKSPSDNDERLIPPLQTNVEAGWGRF